eukprot:COSAG06_NODE_36253_length_449_cov_1.505714_1_plen_61_part_10
MARLAKKESKELNEGFTVSNENEAVQVACIASLRDTRQTDRQVVIYLSKTHSQSERDWRAS